MEVQIGGFSALTAVPVCILSTWPPFYVRFIRPMFVSSLAIVPLIRLIGYPFARVEGSSINTRTLCGRRGRRILLVARILLPSVWSSLTHRRDGVIHLPLHLLAAANA